MAKPPIRNRVSGSAAFNRLLGMWQDLRFGRQLACKVRRVTPEDRCIVFCLIRNRLPQLDHFYDHYRRLGADHFVFIDNGSTDGFADWYGNKPDVSVWHGKKTRRAAGSKAYWLNYLLKTIGAGRLCIIVEVGELLVYPHMQTRSLKDLGQFMKENGQHAMGGLVIDAYGDRPAAELGPRADDDPFDVFPFFDRDGYVQTKNSFSGTLIQGGPGLRVLKRPVPKRAPALDRIPVVWWRKHYRYRSAGRSLWPSTLNRMTTGKAGISLSACLFRFDLAMSPEHRMTPFYDEDVSIRYEGTAQLISLGLMSQGEWL
jgi:hypothetical protein